MNFRTSKLKNCNKGANLLFAYLLLSIVGSICSIGFLFTSVIPNFSWLLLLKWFLLTLGVALILAIVYEKENYHCY